MSEALPLELFEYELPAERIAQKPAVPRDASRLLTLNRESGLVGHCRFLDLPGLLNPGDLLVVNQTQVIPARVNGKRPTGGKVELLFHRALNGDLLEATRWLAMGKPGKALKEGAEVLLSNGHSVRVVGREGQMVVIESKTPLWPTLEAAGDLPLPPYIGRSNGNTAADKSDYQTVFAQEPGAVAAPTASLHFTDRVLKELAAAGIKQAPVTLHVGPGTFLPVRPECSEDIRQHQMHGELYCIPQKTLDLITETRAAGNRVVAVGTTVVRALETYAKTGQESGESTIFIYPGYEFSLVDALVTNFHLPRSTLLMLVSAFASRDAVMAAYGEALEEKYRFFSYGDAMLLF